jgi:hypothetical protein
MDTQMKPSYAPGTQALCVTAYATSGPHMPRAEPGSVKHPDLEHAQSTLPHTSTPPDEQPMGTDASLPPSEVAPSTVASNREPPQEVRTRIPCRRPRIRYTK